ncbi:MAG: 50S ribosomal protein L29 [Candidatus Marinamargulisbacteria bacterium]
MNITDIRKLKDDELVTKRDELKAEYLDKKLAILNNSEKNTSLLNKLRKDTARINTVLNERNNHE